MLQITEKASEMIKLYLKDREEAPSIRLMLNEGGCSGPSVGMVLDESTDKDVSFQEHGITVVVDKEFLEQIKPVTIDFVSTPMGEGFQISSTCRNPRTPAAPAPGAAAPNAIVNTAAKAGAR